MELKIGGRFFRVSPLFLLFAPLIHFFGPYRKTKIVRLKGKVYRAYVADNVVSRAIGYMFRSPRDIERNEAMLFVFGSTRTVGFWMFDVHFDVVVHFLGSKSDGILMRRGDTNIKKIWGKRFLEVPVAERGVV